MFFVESVFFLSLFIIMYTYVLYPFLIFVLSKIFSRSVEKVDYTPNVTIVIVVYNGEELISKKIDNCLTLDYPTDCLRILVVSDGSTDLTNNIVKQYLDSSVTLLAFPERRGKAACLNDALDYVNDEYVILNDARQELNKNAARELMRNFVDESVGAVSGELMFFDEGRNEFSDGIGVYWRYEKFIRNTEAKIDSVVGVTGAIYALRKSCFTHIPAGVILDDVLIPMNVVLNGKRVIFDSNARAYDFPSVDPAKERQRKTRTTAGNYQLLFLAPELLNPMRNRVWLQFISHKVLRLLSPLFLFFAFVSNGILAINYNLYLVLFITQTLFYLMAAMGVQSPNFGRISIVKVTIAFCSLNWYAVLGGIEYYRNKNAHLW